MIQAILIFVLILLGVTALNATRTAPQTPYHTVASWYGEAYRGKTMANGKPFDPDRLTCATWGYAFGTRLAVRYKDCTVTVVVTDRGPSKRFEERGIDLSRAAFARLARLDLGLIDVEITVLP